MTIRKSLFVVVGALLLIAVPTFAADRGIQAGIDLWHTEGDGSTRYSFDKSPIPAGFFCAGSEPFSGAIHFQGAPVATDRPGELGRADTIVQRLDDAVFDKKGVATTRVQIKALNLESVVPVKTSCGLFNVRASLSGEQPVTRMRIIRENEQGGRYIAPLNVNFKLTFTRVGRTPSEPRVLESKVEFLPVPKAFWSNKPGEGGLERTELVKVDTDGDGEPDTFLPGTSNFFPGWRMGKAAGGCHCADAGCSEMHCPNGQILYMEARIDS